MESQRGREKGPRRTHDGGIRVNKPQGDRGLPGVEGPEVLPTQRTGDSREDRGPQRVNGVGG